MSHSFFLQVVPTKGQENGGKKRDGSWPRFCHESSNNQNGKLTGPPPLARLIVSSQYPLKDPNPALRDSTETILNRTLFMADTILKPKHKELKNLTKY